MKLSQVTPRQEQVTLWVGVLGAFGERLCLVLQLATEALSLARSHHAPWPCRALVRGFLMRRTEKRSGGTHINTETTKWPRLLQGNKAERRHGGIWICAKYVALHANEAGEGGTVLAVLRIAIFLNGWKKYERRYRHFSIGQSSNLSELSIQLLRFENQELDGIADDSALHRD